MKSALSPLSTAAIGATGVIGACLGGYVGSRLDGIISALALAQAGGALGLEVGARCFNYSSAEHVKLRVNSLEEFCQDRGKILSVVKSYLIAGSVFCLFIGDNPYIPTGALLYSIFNLIVMERFNPTKRNFILSTLSLGAVGTAGIIAGSVAGYRFGGLSAALALAQTGGFLGLHLGERYLAKDLSKGHNGRGVNTLGQFFNDRLKLLNITKYFLLAGAIWNNRWMIGDLAGRCSYFPCGIFNHAQIIAVPVPAYVIYRAAMTYFETNKFNKKWVFDNREIRVFQERSQLKLEISDLKTNATVEQPLPIGGSLGKQIAHFKDSEVVLEPNGQLSFAKPLLHKELRDYWLETQSDPSESTCKKLDKYFGALFFGSVGSLLKKSNDCISACTGSLGSASSRDKKIPRDNRWGQLTLLPGKHRLVWQIVLTDSEQTMQIPFSCITFEEFGHWIPDYRQKNLDLASKFKNLKSRVKRGKISIEGCTRFLKNFQIEDVENKGGFWDPKYFVKLKPFITNAVSFFDSKYPISSTRCVVTLVCTNGSNPLAGQHAAIIIESIKDKKYLMQMAHLTLQRKNDKERSKIKTSIFTKPEVLDYTHRSRCWTTTPSKVNIMLESIEKEKLAPPGLTIFGGNSLFTSEGKESCITWAKRKLLLLDIQIEEGTLDKLITITTLYTTIKNDH